MNRKFGIGILIACFGLSGVHAGWATENIEISPIIVQPNDLSEINDQMIEQDRINRDQELAIRGLVDENQKLTNTALARQQDATLDQINQTMIKYRDSLLLRDRVSIMTNAQKVSKYHDLIKLTEYVDDSKGVGQVLELKRDVLEGKYKILTDLKDEMKTLNQKLKDEATYKNLDKLSQQQASRIEFLTQQLNEMDRRIAQYDAILAEKDQQIAQLKYNLAKVQGEAKTKDEVINYQKEEISILQGRPAGLLKSSTNKVELPPIIVNADGKEEIIKQQQKQVAVLEARVDELTSRQERIRSEADQLTQASEQLKDQGPLYANLKAAGVILRDKVNSQDLDLKAKDETIRWLKQVLAVAKNKAKYYQLGSQQSQLSMQQVQNQVRNIKDDFTQRFKDYDQFENSIVSLKNQVNRLGLQLSEKQGQVDLLKSELENKITEVNQANQASMQLSRKNRQQVDLLKSEISNITAQQSKRDQEQAQVQQDLKDQLQDRENQIVKMKADILAILDDRANKEIYLHNASMQLDNRVKLAQQLIGLQQEEAALLEEKSDLVKAQDAIFERHSLALENKIKGLMSYHQTQTLIWESRMQDLQNQLGQTQQQVELLKTELANKITEERNQGVLVFQIQDLKAQLQDKEDQITTMQEQLQGAQEANENVESLKQQLAAQQDKVDLLKEELENKIAESNKTTVILGDYQKKLESKDNAYNEQLGEALSSKNYQAHLESEILELNARLQEKEVQVVKIKKDMYDLQEQTSDKDRAAQAQDLNSSMAQQKMMDEKINEYQDKINGLQATSASQVQVIASLRAELTQVRQKLDGVPSSDEMLFLRTGLKKATQQLKQKDAILAQVKANADEYAKEFKEQTQEFQSLKDQLQDAQDEINHKDEDLKYKNLETIRLKMLLKESQVKAHENNASSSLQVQLKSANAQIRELQVRLNQLKSVSYKDTLGEKLKQALDKIDEQGRVINVLVQKLEANGQSVNLTQIVDNQ